MNGQAWHYAYGEGAMERKWNERTRQETAAKAAEQAKFVRNLSYVGNSKNSRNQVRNPYILGKVGEYMYGRNPRNNYPEIELYSGKHERLNNYYERQYGSFSTYSEQEIRDALSEPIIRQDFAKYILPDFFSKYKDVKFSTNPIFRTILLIAFDKEGEDPISQFVRTKSNPSKFAEGNIMMGLVMKLLQQYRTEENIYSYYNKYQQTRRNGKAAFGELFSFNYDEIKEEMQNAKNKNDALKAASKMFEEAEATAEAVEATAEVPTVSTPKCIGKGCAIMGGRRKTYRRKYKLKSNRSRRH